jgi:hypothetical protein
MAHRRDVAKYKSRRSMPRQILDTLCRYNFARPAILA